MKNSTHRYAERGLTVVAAIAALFWHRSDTKGLTIRARGLAAPANFFEVFAAGFLGWISFVQLNDVHASSVLPLYG